MNEHTISTPKAARVKESFTLKNATIFGGGNLLADYAKAAGLNKLFARHLAVNKAPWAIYPMHESMAAFVLGTALGHGRIFHFTGLEDDPLLAVKTGWVKMPDYTTFYHDIHRFDTTDKVDSLRPVLAALARRTMDKRCILDFDSTVETVYGSQEGASVGYNKEKPGRPSYHPLLVFDGLSQALLNEELRKGTAGSATGFKDFLHRTMALYPGVTVNFIRMDAGFAGEEVYAEAQKLAKHGYVAKIKQFPALMGKAKLFPWRRVEFTDFVVEVKSFNYQAVDWSKTRRIVMIRYRPAHIEPQNGQMKLNELDWKQAAMVTELDWAAEDVWHFYNQRCSQENYIKEMKNGFGMNLIPSADFAANHAMLFVKGAAYNLVLGLRKEIGTPVFRQMTVARLRRDLLLIPAVLVRHARRICLKLAANFRWQEDYLLMRQRLDALL